jgi:hypothetical protein
MPAHEMPMRKLVSPAMNRKPPIQSTRASFEMRDVFAVVSSTYRGTRTKPKTQKGN